MGDSFGCIEVSAMAPGAPGAQSGGAMVRSAVLVQGALSIWSFCADIPSNKGTAGYFNRLLKEGLISGPIVTTQSQFDKAVGTFYPLAAGLKHQTAFGDWPKYGGVGSFGIQGCDNVATRRTIGTPTANYHFQAAQSST